MAAMLVWIAAFAWISVPATANLPPEITTADVTTAYLDVLYYVDYEAKDPDRGDPVVSSASFFDPARSWTSAAWAVDKGYAVGGRNGEAGPWVLDDIVEVPSGYLAGSTEYEHGYPPGRFASSAIWANNYLYVFGGEDDAGMPAPTIRFDPPNHTTTEVPNAIDEAYTSAVFDGQDAYVFGGTFDIFAVNDISKFNPSTETTTLLTTSLPTARYGTSAIWDGKYAYIFGGDETLFTIGGLLDEILRFDPVSQTVVTLSVALPTARYGTSAAFDGYYAYIFGGKDDAGNLDDILRFDTTSETLTTLSATLPSPRTGTSAMWTKEDKGYILGGTLESSESDEKVTFQVPRDTLTWSLATGPAFLSMDAVTGVLQGTPGTSDIGDHAVTVMVGDGNGGQDSHSFTLTVSGTAPNNAPMMSGGNVSPAMGYTTDPFTYSVIYTDSDNDAPSYIRVHIDGDAGHAMSVSTSAPVQYRDGNYANGEQYIYVTYLTFGNHNFHFEASDGELNVREPVLGAIFGPSVHSSKDSKARADLPVYGKVTGNYTFTHTSNDSYESITEVLAGKKPKLYSRLEHRWNFTVSAGNKVTFYLEAYRSVPIDADNFVFEWSYSRDSGYKSMLTVTKTSDDDTYQTFELPGNTQGVVYVRVRDMDRTYGNTSLDTVHIDHMFIRSVTTP